MGTWTEADFDQLSWHDCHVHGLSLTEGEHGCGDLVLDIDFITAWERVDEGSIRFRVAPATLVFRNVFGLVITVDYAKVGSGVVPFSIDGIAREPIASSSSLPEYRYALRVNWPEGEISFTGYQFTQTLRAEPIATDKQYLERHERAAILGGT